MAFWCTWSCKERKRIKIIQLWNTDSFNYEAPSPLETRPFEDGTHHYGLSPLGMHGDWGPPLCRGILLGPGLYSWSQGAPRAGRHSLTDIHVGQVNVPSRHGSLERYVSEKWEGEANLESKEMPSVVCCILTLMVLLYNTSLWVRIKSSNTPWRTYWKSTTLCICWNTLKLQKNTTLFHWCIKM